MRLPCWGGLYRRLYMSPNSEGGLYRRLYMSPNSERGLYRRIPGGQDYIKPQTKQILCKSQPPIIVRLMTLVS